VKKDTYEAFVRNFKSTSARYLLEEWLVGVIVGDQIAVQVIG